MADMRPAVSIRRHIMAGVLRGGAAWPRQFAAERVAL